MRCREDEESAPIAPSPPTQEESTSLMVFLASGISRHQYPQMSPLVGFGVYYVLHHKINFKVRVPGVPKYKPTLALSGKIVFGNTDVLTPPGAIVKVFTESGGRCFL